MKTFALACLAAVLLALPAQADNRGRLRLFNNNRRQNVTVINNFQAQPVQAFRVQSFRAAPVRFHHAPQAIIVDPFCPPAAVLQFQLQSSFGY